MTTRLPLIIALSLAPLPALAQGFSGAYISAETLGYSSDEDYGSTTYSGGLEFVFGPGLGLGADFSAYGFETLGGDATSMTFHGNYEVNPVTNVGLFYGADSYDSTDSVFYGAEGQASFGGTTAELFIGESEGDLANGRFFGASGNLVFGTLGLTASYSRFNADLEIDHFSLAGEWNLGLGPKLYAEWGQFSGDRQEDYVALGVRLSIGPGAGTTYGPRSIFEIIPGF